MGPRGKRQGQKVHAHPNAIPLCCLSEIMASATALTGTTLPTSTFTLMEIALLPSPTCPYPLCPALSMVPRAGPTAVCSRSKHHKALGAWVFSQGLHNKNILVLCASLSQRFVASERQACQVPVGSISCASWPLFPNGWSAQQLMGKAEQGEAALAALQLYDVLLLGISKV